MPALNLSQAKPNNAQEACAPLTPRTYWGSLKGPGTKWPRRAAGKPQRRSSSPPGHGLAPATRKPACRARLDRWIVAHELLICVCRKSGGANLWPKQKLPVQMRLNNCACQEAGLPTMGKAASLQLEILGVSVRPRRADNLLVRLVCEGPQCNALQPR